MLAHIQMARVTYTALIERMLQWQVKPPDGPELIIDKVNSDSTEGLNVRGSNILTIYRRNHPHPDIDNI
jgi:hypothetical protein